METITTTFKNKYGLTISVLVEQPDSTKGLIVICHGFLSAKNRASVSMMAKTALENNITALRFDMTNASGESDGSPELGTITSFVEDLTDVMDWAQTQEWYQEPFIMAGSSLGGIAILEYANAHPNKVKALAPIATVISGTLSVAANTLFNPEESTLWQQQGYKEIDDPRGGDGTIHIPWSHMEDRMQYDALSYASSLRMPCLQIVGSEDEFCPSQHQQMLHDALGSSSKELHIVPSAPHTLKQPEHLGQFQQHFDQWLKKVTQ